MVALYHNLKKVGEIMRRKEEKGKSKFATIICIILLIIMLPILVINGVILINSFVNPNEIPNFMGYKPFIVLSGSMEPTINTGDLAISKETNPNTLKVGDIISFKIKEDVVVTHRIVEITKEDGELAFITKGDHNYENDQNPVKASSVEGIYVKKLDGLGNFAMFIQKPLGFIVVAAIPLIIIIIAQTYNSRQYKKEIEGLRKNSKK